MLWEVLYSEQATTWIAGLDRDAYRHVMAAMEMLRQRGPALGRPLVDRIEGSRHHNMKELRASNPPRPVRLRSETPSSDPAWR